LSVSVPVPNEPLQSILLVEDDHADALIFRRILSRSKRSPFRLEHVDTVAQALDRIERGNLELVVLDLSLPDSQGIPTYERVRELAPQLPIVVLTGQSEVDVALDLIHRGAQDFLAKDELSEHNLVRSCECAVERMKLLRELEAARQNALVASRAKSAFVSTMSHEIRTPLNAILGMAELLSETPLSSDQREYVQIFRRCGKTLLALLNNVLDLAKLEAGKLELAVRELDPHALVQDAVETFAFEAHSRGLAMISDVADEVPERVVSDPMRLSQVLFNLVGNAVKFTERGRIILRLRWSAQPETAARLYFEVSDTGSGIPEDRLRAVFERFEQASSEVTRTHGGSGLGLALCGELVRLMGGEIEVESRVGAGSTFRFSIPVRVPSRRSRPRICDLSGRRVLVVDDDASERGALVDVLRGWSAEVGEASSVVEARSLIQEAVDAHRPFDTALLDCRMPQEGGLVLARWLRGEEELAPHPRLVALLPMNCRTGDSALCRELDATTVMKPVRRELLAEILCGNGASCAAVPTPAPAPRLEGRTLLVAEDSPDNRVLVLGLLRRTGCRAEVAVDGQEAVERWRELRPDLVLMDIRMPRLDGLDATRRIREEEIQRELGRTPVVALTADAFEEQGQECLAAGCDAHVAKPIEPRGFFSLLDRLLGDAGASAPAEKAPPAPAPGAQTEPAAPAPAQEIEIAIPPEFEDLAPDYLGRRRQELSELRSALAEGDFKRLRTLGHNMKGSGRGYGFPAITRIGAGLQEAAEGEDAGRSERLVAELEGFLDLAEPFVRAGAGPGSPGTPGS
jgi:signal transduction histidine kinase/HPt (histidine-containing phosphotransfer) domain-containing protein